MNSRVEELIRNLQLEPHPEGGYFREIYRSASVVQPSDERDQRSSLTTIYFLLAAGQFSRWHKVRSDEVWHFYEGDSLKLMSIHPNSWKPDRCHLGKADHGQEPIAVIPAGHWQAAQPLGSYSLVGCTVAPGFDFLDFQMLADIPMESEKLNSKIPEWVTFL